MGKDYLIAFYRADTGQEVDIVVYNKLKNILNLYEVKHSTKQETKFLKHINNPDVFKDICDFIGFSGAGDVTKTKIGNSLVIYRGMTTGQYVNVEDFLLNVEKYVI